MLRLYNTLGQRKEEFKPLKEGEVRMYVCGVTVYDHCHLGHARAYVSFDVMRRYLEYQGFKVIYIQNFTDIDDKIIKKAREENKGIEEIACFYTEKYFSVMDKLNVKRADFYPKAIEHVPEMIAAISELIRKGFAYEVDGDVYFSIRSDQAYGRLSKRNLEEMLAGARVEVDSRKKDPLDFALWKKAGEGEPFWPSPWGNGRPGWHIECSVMSAKYLGTAFDIHAGGMDLIFPHHENEISQAFGLSGKTLARYWLHNGFVTIDKEKMSKSLGNSFTLEALFKKYDPEAIRYFLISTHYRHPVDFNEERLREAGISLDSLYQLFRRVEEIEPEIIEKTDFKTAEQLAEKLREEVRVKFNEAMDNDFNTSIVLSLMHDLSREINQAINKWPQGREIGWQILARRDLLKEWGGVLGLFWGKKSEEENETVKKLIAEREEKRRNKDWAGADEIRKRLLDMDIIIEDTTRGTRWYRERRRESGG